ncbi:BamA/TamA family outer membrane protein [Pedobacter sp. MR2016-24]|uniref:BamA/TamA family outer membrane protein n=1 Tax=Pedobacter sp. MR2016-24 TaxID=2994466 RepID=UPI0022471525|nr:BamA/TamA family outer membrane protein [Pedobacter sp. MR2016-24]MCX2482246.1 BamA/TamA family outer membrane protein [Pedobacter sp. MR2016-24]
MKRFLICNFLLLSAFSGSAQMKLIKRMLSEDVDTTRRASFMPLPLLRYSQEVGLEFGAGGLYSTYVDKSDSTNRSSNFAAVLSYSTKKTYNVSLKGDVWTKHNAYHLIGEMRFRSMPFDFFGIGNQTLESGKDRIVQHQVKAMFDVEKNILPFTYTGVSLGFENYSFKDKEIGGLYDTNPAVLGKPGGNVLFIGVSQTYDTRNSNNYPTKGFFGRVSYQYAPDIFGGNDFSGSQIRVVLRNFWPLAKKLVLGVNGIYYTVQSNSTPFYLLPQLGNDEIMRGYYSGRYRDENLLAAQTELRYRFSNRFGLVAFGGGGRVFENGGFSLKQFKPSYGAGIRYFYDPAKGLSVRADYAVGEKRSGEARQSGFYLSLAEAF